MKGLAIAALAATVIGAAAVLYAVKTMTPVVVSAAVNATPATDAQDVFDETLAQLERRTFTGRAFDFDGELRAQDCTFLTYTLRLQNRGFFPAEWITLTVEPKEGDALQLADPDAHVLPARGMGDLSATLLRAGDASDTLREAEIVCYVLGRRVALTVPVGG